MAQHLTLALRHANVVQKPVQRLLVLYVILFWVEAVVELQGLVRMLIKTLRVRGASVMVE